MAIPIIYVFSGTVRCGYARHGAVSRSINTQAYHQMYFDDEPNGGETRKCVGREANGDYALGECFDMARRNECFAGPVRFKFLSVEQMLQRVWDETGIFQTIDTTPDRKPDDIEAEMAYHIAHALSKALHGTGYDWAERCLMRHMNGVLRPTAEMVMSYFCDDYNAFVLDTMFEKACRENPRVTVFTEAGKRK
jgi:hypothetical protein